MIIINIKIYTAYKKKKIKNVYTHYKFFSVSFQIVINS